MLSFLKEFFKSLFRFIVFIFIFQLSFNLIVHPLVVKAFGPIYIIKDVYIDQAFSFEETRMIEDGLMQWQKETNYLVRVKIHPYADFSDMTEMLAEKNSLTFIKMDGDNDYIKQTDDKIGKILGLFVNKYSLNLVILVPERHETVFDFESTVMHEFGHALGLRHINQKWTLMYPYEDFGSFTITKRDLKDFCYIYYCDENKL